MGEMLLIFIINLIINICISSILCAICNTLFERLTRAWIQIVFNLIFISSIILGIISLFNNTNTIRYSISKISPSSIQKIEQLKEDRESNQEELKNSEESTIIEDINFTDTSIDIVSEQKNYLKNRVKDLLENSKK